MNRVGLIVGAFVMLFVSCAKEEKALNVIELSIDEGFITVISLKLLGDEENPIHSVSDIKFDEDSFYLLSSWQNYLYKYNYGGEVIKKVGNRGTGPCDFSNPTKLFLDGDAVGILEIGNNRIQTLSTQLDCGNIINLPFLPMDAIYHKSSRNYTAIGNHFSDDTIKFVHILTDGEVERSFIEAPNDLIYSYYATNYRDNLIWGNNHSTAFYSVDVITGKSKEHKLLDTSFVSLFEKLTDFEIREQSDLQRLRALTRQMDYSYITGVAYLNPYVLVSYRNMNSDKPNKLIIQNLNNKLILYISKIGDYNIIQGDGAKNELIMYKHNEIDHGSIDLKVIRLNKEIFGGKTE